MIFRCKKFSITFPRPVVVMGILNVTPDSFSDGSDRYLHPVEVINRGCQIVEQGGEIIDIGAESTRPGFTEVPPEEEWKRLSPVLQGLRDKVQVPISIDTRHVEVAQRALEAGADIINDLCLGRKGDAMLRLVAKHGAGYILIHSEQLDPEQDSIETVDLFFKKSLQECEQVGVDPNQVALDPGIGFGKTQKQNLLLISKLSRYTKCGRPLLLGASRKSFMKTLPGGDQDPKDRMGGSLAAACYAVQHGANIVRVHDVMETVQAVRLTEILDKECKDAE